MPRTMDDIDDEIDAIKKGNPKWMSDSVVLATITALTNRQNNLQGKLH